MDYLFAYVFGIVFHYLTIGPMRGLGLRDGVIAATKADTLFLTAKQIGMYGFMAVTYIYFLKTQLSMKLQIDMVGFLFMIKLPMVCGFLTTYPVNWWLIQR